MFQTVPLSIIRSYSLYTQQWHMSYRFVDSFQAGAVPSLSRLKAVYKPVWRIPLLSVQWITPDDGQRNCPNHVRVSFQNKCDKLVHLVGFIIRKYLQYLENSLWDMAISVDYFCYRWPRNGRGWWSICKYAYHNLSFHWSQCLINVIIEVEYEEVFSLRKWKCHTLPSFLQGH
jgi:hypothetical protein